MSKPFKVSQSKIKTWLRCRRAYYYRYILELKAKKKARPLQFGDIVHQMLDAYANADDPFELLHNIGTNNARLFAEEREMYGNIIEDIRLIMTDYFRYYPEDSIRYIRKGGRGAELELEVWVNDDLVITGKIDGIIATRNRLRWLLENKSFTHLPNEDQRWRNLQSSLYIRMIEVVNLPSVEGSCWNYIRSKPPATPQILKSGKYSSRKIDTLPSVIEQIANPSRRMIEQGQEGLKRWFKRIYVPVKKKVVDQVFNDFVEVSREVQERGEASRPMSIERHCDWCEYEPLCRGELNGSDVEFIKARQFTSRTKPAADRKIITGNL